jgi:hypothetical protein
VESEVATAPVASLDFYLISSLATPKSDDPKTAHHIIHLLILAHKELIY